MTRHSLIFGLPLLLWTSVAIAAPFLIVRGVYSGRDEVKLLPEAAEVVWGPYPKLSDEDRHKAGQIIGPFLTRMAAGQLSQTEKGIILSRVTGENGSVLLIPRASDLQRRLNHCSASMPEALDTSEREKLILVRLICDKDEDVGPNIYAVFRIADDHLKTAVFTVGETLPVHIDFAGHPDLIARYGPSPGEGDRR